MRIVIGLPCLLPTAYSFSIALARTRTWISSFADSHDHPFHHEGERKLRQKDEGRRQKAE